MDQIFKTKMIVMLWHFHEFSCCNLFGGVPWDEISYGARVAKSIILWSLPLLHDKCKNIDRDGVVNFGLRSWILWNIIHNCENHELSLLPDKGQNHLNGIALKMFRLKIWRQYHWQCYQIKSATLLRPDDLGQNKIKSLPNLFKTPLLTVVHHALISSVAI